MTASYDWSEVIGIVIDCAVVHTTQPIALHTGGGPDQQVSNGAIRNRLHCLCEGALVFRTAAQACPLHCCNAVSCANYLPGYANYLPGYAIEMIASCA